MTTTMKKLDVAAVGRCLNCGLHCGEEASCSSFCDDSCCEAFIEYLEAEAEFGKEDEADPETEQ